MHDMLQNTSGGKQVQPSQTWKGPDESRLEMDNCTAAIVKKYSY